MIRDAASPIDEIENDKYITRKLKPIMVKALYPLADEKVALSFGVRHGMQEAYGLDPDSISVIYNPVDVERIRAEATKVPDHPWIRENGTTPLLVAVGRLCFQKGFDILLAAVAELSRRRNFRLMILGEGEARKQLLDLADSYGVRGGVSMLGFVRNPYAYIAHSSGFVFSSRWEGLGNALIEAMCCGVPIVATNCRYGPAEVLEQGRYGLLVEPGDVSALADGMEAVLNKQVSPPDVRASARFNPDIIVNQYLEIMFR